MAQGFGDAYAAFGGTFQVQGDQGPITVQLYLQADRLNGYLQGPGVYLSLEGWVEEGGVAVGVASSADGQLGFEAMVEGDTLGIWFYEVVNGVVLPETEIEVILTRVGQAPAAAGAPGAAGALGAAGAGTPGAAGAAGTDARGGKLIPPAPPAAMPPAGGAAGMPPAGGAQAQQPAPQAGSPVVATGQFAYLTQDDANAFIEALEFVLAQIGYPYGFTPDERVQALQAVAQSFPTLAQPDQVALSQARWIWERVRANWASASPADQQEFVVGVLVLAFGEETVRQWAGGARGGGGQCQTFEDCTAGYLDDATALDTMNTQSCWAAAGCEGYDPTTDTFDYGGSGY